MDSKNAIVTGASRGIGRAIVEKFAQNGINVWACASYKRPEFEEDMKALEKRYHVWIKPVYFNLKDSDAIRAAVTDIKNEREPVDILVNNAGISKVAVFSMLTMEQVREVFECNFFGPLLLTQYVQKMMIKNAYRGGVIVNIGSVSGLCPERGYAAYGSSKAALMFFSKVLAEELRPYHIRVNAVAPGMVETEMVSYKDRETTERIIGDTWLLRQGKPKEIADVVYFLTSDAALNITGEVINVDGGRLR